MKSTPVSVVMGPCDDVALLERSLAPLLAELEQRKAGDEVIVVDDTGTGAVAAWLNAQHPPPLTFDRATVDVRALVQKHSGSYAQAVNDGVESAAHAHVFVMREGVVVRAGFLEPLLRALDAAGVFAVSPRVLVHDEEARVDTAAAFAWRDACFAAPNAPTADDADAPLDSVLVAHVANCAMLVRRADFLELGGFDPLFAGLGCEEVDASWRAARAGRSTVIAPDSIVDHVVGGTPAADLAPAVARAALERNRLLVTWKHLADDARIRTHLDALCARVADAALTECEGDVREDDLRDLVLALEDVPALLAARRR